MFQLLQTEKFITRVGKIKSVWRSRNQILCFKHKSKKDDRKNKRPRRPIHAPNIRLRISKKTEIENMGEEETIKEIIQNSEKLEVGQSSDLRVQAMRKDVTKEHSSQLSREGYVGVSRYRAWASKELRPGKSMVCAKGNCIDSGSTTICLALASPTLF